MGLLQRFRKVEDSEPRNGYGVAHHQVSSHTEKEGGAYDNSPVKFLTVRSLLMGVLVSMGGFIFGYDTGTSCWRKELSKG